MRGDAPWESVTRDRGHRSATWTPRKFMRSARTPLLVTLLLALLALTACSGDDGSDSSTPAAAATGTVTSLPPATTSSSSAQASTPAPASSPASKQPPGTPSKVVRVCGAEQVDAQGRECDAMQRGFSSSTVYCSADLPSSVTGKVDVSLLRNGAPVYGATADRVDPSQSLLLSFGVGRLRLPAGTYGCQFKAGTKTWTGWAPVSGPSGLASQTMACDGSTMVRTGAIAHCPTTAATLTSPRSIGCSSVVTDVAGKQIDILVHTPSGDRKAAAGRQANGIAVVQLSADARQLGGRIAQGDYSCTFLVDGKQVSRVPFTVA
ncbi:hypothetical protein VV01_11225 [Luteipulveratus halotolerans]|uniref:Uncharacterized protein n=2 Tax=Luteipulveratus halotolerans TaxID=1631356 RepID=A0A0L6CJA8_9MICO|nr:hypothetical protein VV01_11225 [Luteipulveratus halotolerans]